jgi:hypothetical protein
MLEATGKRTGLTVSPDITSIATRARALGYHSVEVHSDPTKRCASFPSVANPFCS